MQLNQKQLYHINSVGTVHYTINKFACHSANS